MWLVQVECHEGSYLECFERERLVYLSSEAEEVQATSYAVQVAS